MKVIFSKFERVDCASDEMDAYVGDTWAGGIIKTHAQPIGALSSVDSRGLVESYEVEVGDVCEMFLVENFKSARAALAAAKQAVTRLVEQGHHES